MIVSPCRLLGRQKKAKKIYLASNVYLGDPSLAPDSILFVVYSLVSRLVISLGRFIAHIIRFSCKSQIITSVILSVAVSMVRHFTQFKLAPDYSFEYQPMEKGFLSLLLGANIAKGITVIAAIPIYFHQVGVNIINYKWSAIGHQFFNHTCPTNEKSQNGLSANSPKSKQTKTISGLGMILSKYMQLHKTVSALRLWRVTLNYSISREIGEILWRS